MQCMFWPLCLYVLAWMNVCILRLIYSYMNVCIGPMYTWRHIYAAQFIRAVYMRRNMKRDSIFGASREIDNTLSSRS